MDSLPQPKPILVRARRAASAVRSWLLTALPLQLALGWRRLFSRKKPGMPEPAAVREILVLRLDNLGDVLMSTPIYRELKRGYPAARITVAVRRSSHALLERNPSIDQILCLEHGSLAGSLGRLIASLRFYWSHLRGRRFDVVLHPRTGDDYLYESLFLALLDAPVSIGYRMRKGNHGFDRSQVLTRALPFPEPKSEVFANADVVTALTGVPFAPELELSLDAEDHRFAERRLASVAGESLVVGLGIGASTRRRQWPAAQWAETLRLLAGQHRMVAVLFAAQGDAALAQAIAAELGSALDAQIIVDAPLRVVAACIARCGLFLGTDSALAHIAATMKVPVVVVSPHPRGGDPAHENSPERFAPFAPQVRVVRPERPRPPCVLACTMAQAHCILEIEPADVAQAAEQLLRAQPDLTESGTSTRRGWEQT